MRKFKLVIALAISVLCFSAQAQNSFAKGDFVANLGVGLGSYIGGSGYDIVVPPVSLSGDYCIVDGLIRDRASIGVGGYVAYMSNKYVVLNDYGWKYNYVIVGARGTFHFAVSEKFDVYAGILVGYNASSSSIYGTDIKLSAEDALDGLIHSEFIGARYWFVDNIGAFAEIGYGIAPVQLGLSFKF
jgi:hypothetical protein